MSESSILWTTDGVGDGINAGYSTAQVSEWMRMLMCGLTGADLSGVSPDYLNELEATGTATPVAINTGGGLIYGYPYFNSASVDVAIPTPSASTRVDLIVVEADWSAQTVRITRVAGTEGAGAPSLTQTAGTTWQMELAEVSITTGGVITVTDGREWLTAVGDGAVVTAKLADEAITTAKLADDSVTAAKIDGDLGVTFNDSEGDPADLGSSADGTSDYAARRDHAHKHGDNLIEWTHFRQGYARPTVVLRPSANQDFTTEVTAAFLSQYDYDDANIFSATSGEVTFSPSEGLIEWVCSGNLGHATGTTQSWATLYLDIYTTYWGSQVLSYRTFYVPSQSWGAFSVSGIYKITAANTKFRMRIARTNTTDTLRLSSDSMFYLKVMS